MGISHLREIEEYLENQENPVSKTKIRNDLGINMQTVEESLKYLLDQNKIYENNKRYIYRFILKKPYVQLLGTIKQLEEAESPDIVTLRDHMQVVGMGSMAHLSIVFKQFEQDGFITKIAQKNRVKFSLTEKGKAVVAKLQEAVLINDQWDNDEQVRIKYKIEK